MRWFAIANCSLTGILTLRTRPLCALSYGDVRSNPWPISSTGSHPALSKVLKEMKGLGRSINFAFMGLKWCARPVTLRYADISITELMRTSRLCGDAAQ
jgi:hypothetical protein